MSSVLSQMVTRKNEGRAEDGKTVLDASGEKWRSVGEVLVQIGADGLPLKKTEKKRVLRG